MALPRRLVRGLAGIKRRAAGLARFDDDGESCCCDGENNCLRVGLVPFEHAGCNDATHKTAAVLEVEIDVDAHWYRDDGSPALDERISIKSLRVAVAVGEPYIDGGALKYTHSILSATMRKYAYLRRAGHFSGNGTWEHDANYTSWSQIEANRALGGIGANPGWNGVKWSGSSGVSSNWLFGRHPLGTETHYNPAWCQHIHAANHIPLGLFADASFGFPAGQSENPGGFSRFDWPSAGGLNPYCFSGTFDDGLTPGFPTGPSTLDFTYLGWGSFDVDFTHEYDGVYSWLKSVRQRLIITQC